MNWYHLRMSETNFPAHAAGGGSGWDPNGKSGGLFSGVTGWWRLIHFGALLVAMALSPSTYSLRNRLAVSTQICQTAAQILPRFVLFSALVSLVLIHIVVVTAQSYGLSQFALGMVIRVLVVELLPLSAALFVALRSDLGSAAELAAIRRQTASAPLRGIEMDNWRQAILPRVIANSVAVVSLVTLSGGLALVLGYLGVYGFSPWGVSSFTRTVGQVFEPIVIMSLGLKTTFFSLAVAIIPAVARHEDSHHVQRAAGDVQQGRQRLFIVLIAIETLSLAVEFF
jgi:phospholipid/cholesterol/gamma-HCH transport system permease protein